MGIVDEERLLAKTHDEPEYDESGLLQSFRERFPSRGMSLLATYNNRHYFHCAVGDSKGDDDATEPAVHQVECIVRDVEPADQRVVPAGHDYQWDHVDDCKSTGTITKVLQLGSDGAIPFNTVGAEDDIHGDGSHE